MLTLSPNPEYREFAEQVPDVQFSIINKILRDTKIYKYLAKRYNYNILGIHYEFNTSGNLHAHVLCSIKNEFVGYQRNLITISKMYHKVCGLAYNRSSICADVRPVDNKNVYAYLNKENAYKPQHTPIGLVQYWQQTESDKTLDTTNVLPCDYVDELLLEPIIDESNECVI